jgi:hypothetical protein
MTVLVVTNNWEHVGRWLALRAQRVGISGESSAATKNCSSGNGELGPHPLADSARDCRPNQTGPGQTMCGVLVTATQAVDEQVGLAAAGELSPTVGHRAEHGQPASGDRLVLLISSRLDLDSVAHCCTFTTVASSLSSSSASAGTQDTFPLRYVVPELS